MADFEDIQDVLASIVAQVAYPDGTGDPSLIGVPVKVMKGWPVLDDVMDDLAKGRVQVSVWAANEERNTTRHMDFDEWYVVDVPDPTITLTPSGTDVVVGGTIASPQNVGFIVDQHVAAYGIQPGDTLNSIATAVANLLVGVGVTATSTGPTIHLPGSKKITARVGIVGTILRQLSRQEKDFTIIVWAPDVEKRRILAEAIDVDLKKRSFLLLPDTTEGRIRYVRSLSVDRFEKHLCYRRDLCYTVEWATTETDNVAQINIVELNLRDPDDQIIKTVNF